MRPWSSATIRRCAASRSSVGGDPTKRGVVAAASYEARAFGVRSAIPMSRAVRLCPSLIIVRPDFQKYRTVSEQVFAIYRSVTPLVEPLSLDEAYLDVTENAWQRAARRDRRPADQAGDPRRRPGLTASAGVAPNKFLAKIASGWKKPDGLTVIAPERIESFLQGLPVDALWGVGPKTAERLRAHGIERLVDVRAQSLDAAARRSSAVRREWLRDLSLGQRRSAGRAQPRAQVVRVGMHLREGPHRLSTHSRNEIDEMARDVARWLDKHAMFARTVVIKVRYDDFTTITRSHSDPRPTRDEADLHRARAAPARQDRRRAAGPCACSASACTTSRRPNPRSVSGGPPLTPTRGCRSRTTYSLMRIPDVDYIRWAKTLPAAAIDLARSSVEPCPSRLLGVRGVPLAVNDSAHDGYAPFVDALAERYRVSRDRVFTVSGGASLANWIACAIALEGAHRGDEIILERPTYEPLLRIAHATGLRVRRLERRFAEGFDVNVEQFQRLVNRRTRLAIFTNLHNPSGARLAPATLRGLARALDAVGARLLIDEVYLECLFTDRTASSVHAGSNVLVTNSLTKAYGLAGLRAGWILGPRALVQRAWRAQDLWSNNNVTPAEQLAASALSSLSGIRRHTHRHLAANRARVVRFLRDEPRIAAHLPAGGTVICLRLPNGVDEDRLAAHMLRRYSTLIVPGRFFEAPHCVRIGLSGAPRLLERGLANLTAALDDLQRARPRRV